MPMYHYQRPENLNGIVYNIPQRPEPTKAEQMKQRRDKATKAMIKLFDKIEALERQGKVMNVDFTVQDTIRLSDGYFFPCPHIVTLKPVE